MGNDIQRNIIVDPNLSSYEPFFDSAWAQAIDTIAVGTILVEPVFELTVSWKSISATHAMPWLLCTSMNGLAQRSLKEGETSIMCPVMERAIREKLLAKVPGLSHAKRQQITNALFEIRQEAEQFSRAGSESIETAEESWEKMLEIPVIQVGLWGAERICFSALFHAYENFVRHVFGLIAHNDPGYRIKDLKAFPSDFEKAFGAELAQTCLNDVEVRNARIVRNAVAHNGGRNTGELRKVQHDFPIHDDQIQITAQHTRTLHQSLKERSLRLAEAGKEILGKRVS